MKLYDEALQILLTCSASLTILVQKLPPALKNALVEAKSSTLKFDNDFAKDGMKFCELGIQRLQQITKAMLKLAKEAKNDSLQDRCKKAYAAALTRNPENPGDWPKKMLEILNNLKPFLPPPSSTQ